LAEGEINNKFIDDLAVAYSLTDLRDKLVRFIKENFNLKIYPEPPKPFYYP
jgi:hypothetical protein